MNKLLYSSPIETAARFAPALLSRRVAGFLFMKIEESVGQRFNRWTVISVLPKEKNVSRKVLCRCECGTEKITDWSNVHQGLSRSCGCLAMESFRRVITKHGLEHTVEYRIWKGIKVRCLNPRRREYPRYGGRGIKICDRWKDSFQNFIDDVGKMPGPDYSIDRIDSNGHYEPSNVRWIPRKDQAKNRPGFCTYITAFGKTMCVAEWAREVGIGRKTIKHRIDSGVPPEKALTK